MTSVSLLVHGSSSRVLPRRAAAGSALDQLVVPLVALVLATSAALIASNAGAAWLAALADLRPLLRVALMSGAGVLCLARWRVTGATSHLLLGAALLLLGLLSEIAVAVAPMLLGAGTGIPAPALRTIPALLAAGLIVWSRRAEGAAAAPVATRLLGLVAVGCGAVILLARPLEASGPATVDALAAAGRAVVWLLVLVAHPAVRRAGRTCWVTVVATLLMLASAAHAFAALHPGPATAAVAVLSVAAGVAAVHGAAGDLAASLSAQTRTLDSLAADMTVSRERADRERGEQAERLHEVRNVLAGLHGATATLRRYEDRLDRGVRGRLEEAISLELQRLQHLVDPPERTANARVRLRLPLEAVITTERELGAVIRADLHDVAARGCAEDVATVCSALLVNARVHAPGSPVLVRCRRVGSQVQVAVEDGGPGVPAELRDVVFERGARGTATAPGSGLGLYNARQIAERMGGALQLLPRPSGGSVFVLSLPAAS